LPPQFTAPGLRPRPSHFHLRWQQKTYPSLGSSARAGA